MSFRYVFIFLLFVSFWGQAPMWYGQGALAAVKWFAMGGVEAAIFAAMASARWRPVRVIGWVMVTLQAILAFVNAFSWAVWGFGLSQTMYVILLETNANEAGGFMGELVNNLGIMAHRTITWVAIVSPFVVAALVKMLSKKAVMVMTAIVVAASCAAIGQHIHESISQNCGRKNISLLLKCAVDVKFTVSHMAITEEQKADFIANMKQVPEIKCADITDNFIFVIGESSSALHWSVYGYALPTTPWVAASQDSLVVFTDVLPPYSSTSRCVPNILTEKNSTSCTDDWNKCVDIIRTARKAGFRTSWISNQEKVGAFLGCIPVMAACTDDCQYVGSVAEDDHQLQRPDDIILAPMNQAVADTAHKHFTLLHTLGSHATYSDRFPHEFARFTTSDYVGTERAARLSEDLLQIVADYDNSILYTDDVLRRVIQSVSSHAGRNVVVYFSDHSEEVCDIDDTFGHAHRKPCIKVPMLIWASHEWRTVNPDLWARLLASRDLPVATENTFHLIHSLLGIESPLYDARLDLSSAEYDSGVKRYFNDEEYVN